MSTFHPSVLALLLILGCWPATTAALGQDNQDVPAEDVAAEIEISDGPAGIDPAITLPAALTELVTVRFDEAFLREVVQWLQEKQEFAAVLDRAALGDEGISISEPVTDQLDDQPLYLLLNRLRTLGVDWAMQDDVLRVASLSAVESEYLSTQSHDVGDLFDEGFEAERLLFAIESVDRDSWESLGGWGTTLVLGDVLFVYQNQRTHRHVTGLLAALREHGRRTLVLDPPRTRLSATN